jgi:pantoate--beta-alanine ligase
MEVVETIEAVRQQVSAARKKGKKIGLVPTMGAFHQGHISLIDRAVKECDFVVVTIFVNPTQFGPGEDFQKYPRSLDADLEMCGKTGVDLVFVPSTGQIYPSENLTWVNIEKLTEPLCGQFRPGHFRGVTTVCAKLFNIVQSDIAFFGQKDVQQAIVIKKMVADLNMPLKIVLCPTVRDADGLALSSRNQYLTDQQRKDATLIYKSLQECKKMIRAGTTDTKKIIVRMQEVLCQAPAIHIEYVSIVDPETLQSLDHITDQILLAVAVKIGPARLIDNIMVDAGKH